MIDAARGRGGGPHLVADPDGHDAHHSGTVQGFQQRAVALARHQHPIERADEAALPPAEAGGLPQMGERARALSHDARHGLVVGPVHLLSIDDARAGKEVDVLRHHDFLDVRDVDPLLRKMPSERGRQLRAAEVRGGIRPAIRALLVLFRLPGSGRSVDAPARARGGDLGADLLCPLATRIADGEDVHRGEAGERADQPEIAVMASVERRLGHVRAEEDDIHLGPVRARISASEKPPASRRPAAANRRSACARPSAIAGRPSKRAWAAQAPKFAARSF